jgi:hypothetical protein
MRQMTVVCDVCKIATRHEPPRDHWQDEQDWMTVVVKHPPRILLDVCPICQHRIYTANTYAGLIAAISDHHNQRGDESGQD